VPEPTVTPLRVPGRAPRVLTIDAEDWFHVCGDDYYSDPRRWDSFVPRLESSLGQVLEALGPGGHRATFFFVGWVARRYPALVREAAAQGHEIGVHGDLHRRADEMSPSEFREDLERARKSVEDAGGAPVNVHRAAEWSIRRPGDSALAQVASAGFLCDASMMPVPPLGSAASPPGPTRIHGDGWAVTELPPLTGRVLGRRLPLGGAWPFRMLPEARLAAAEEEARRGGQPAVFTLHPWELDAAHPPADGFSAITRLVHFAGLRGLPARWTRWLGRDRCVAIGDVLPALQPA
jgi:polysaccharide deacetylase family protein (PEP-CTERM system associated)